MRKQIWCCLWWFAELRKEHERGGLRKEIVQSEDEEDAKKVNLSLLDVNQLFMVSDYIFVGM